MSERRVLFVQPTEPAAYPPLINAASLMAEHGWDPTFLSAPLSSNLMTMPQIPRLRVESISERADFTLSKKTYANYCARAVLLAREVRPQVIYASDPNGAIPGLLAARATGGALVYHEHDSPNCQAELHPLVALARKLVLQTAVHVIFPNLSRAEHAQRQLGFRFTQLSIVWNCPRRSEVVPLQPRSDNPLIVHYHGSITPDRLPETVAEAMASLPITSVLRIVGYETASGMGHVARLRDRYGSAEKGGLIEFVGQIAREELLHAAATAHIGLSLMPTASSDINMRSMVGASNKAFDYMAAGLPLLVSDLPDWREMFVDGGHAAAADPTQVTSISAALRQLFESSMAREEIGALNRKKVLDEWNYDEAFLPVIEALHRVCPK